jgi:Ala-tRNA(Pro) deacylase
LRFQRAGSRSRLGIRVFVHPVVWARLSERRAEANARHPGENEDAEDAMSLEQNILDRMQEHGVRFEAVEHEPVYTNPAMAEALGVTEAETVKSLVVKTKEGELAVVVLPGDAKMDWKRTAASIGTKKVSFAKPEVVSDRVGCEVGCVPPFGHPLPVVMDRQLTEYEHVYFNPGVHHKSFRITSSKLVELCEPTFLD